VDVGKVIEMVTWKLKACPRCGSDMYIEKDFDDVYQKCLMCSYRIDLEKVPVKKVPVAAGVFDGDFDDERPDDK
jgi:DNA-directed RNA polymerase subunit RPC12/RpoP